MSRSDDYDFSLVSWEKSLSQTMNNYVHSLCGHWRTSHPPTWEAKENVHCPSNQTCYHLTLAGSQPGNELKIALLGGISWRWLCFSMGLAIDDDDDDDDDDDFDIWTLCQYNIWLFQREHELLSLKLTLTLQLNLLYSQIVIGTTVVR